MEPILLTEPIKHIFFFFCSIHAVVASNSPFTLQSSECDSALQESGATTGWGQSRTVSSLYRNMGRSQESRHHALFSYTQVSLSKSQPLKHPPLCRQREPGEPSKPNP